MANPTMSVAERCDIIWHHMRHSGGQGQQALFDLIAEQIRQAEQAAYERAAQVADSPANFAEAYTVERKYVARVCRKVAAAIRALAQEPEEVG